MVEPSDSNRASIEKSPLDELRYSREQLIFLDRDADGDVPRPVMRLLGKAIGATPITQCEATRRSFPLGHPQNRMLYVKHPAKPRFYCPAAQFHYMVFEHKFFEAVRLLMSLGVRSLEVEHVSGWAKDMSLRLHVPPVLTNGEVDARGGRRDRLLFQGKFDGGDDPAVPTDLVWYRNEPGWLQVAEGRLRFGLKEFTMYFSYEDDFGVNVGLQVRARMVGLEIGGSLMRHQATVWKMIGTF
jgi:hypothetical protein